MSVQTAVDEDPVAPQTYDWQLFKRLLSYLRPYLGAAATAFGLIVVMAGLDLVGPWLTKVAIDRYIAVGDADGLMILPKDRVVEIANRAQDVLEGENRLRAEIREGRTLSQVAYLERWEKQSGK